MRVHPALRCRADIGHSWLPLRDESSGAGRGRLLLECQNCKIRRVDWTATRRVFAVATGLTEVVRGPRQDPDPEPAADPQARGVVGPRPLALAQSGAVAEARPR
jgi:hypothetical protein